MRRRWHEFALTLCAGVGLLALPALSQLRRTAPLPPRGPQTVAEALPAIQALGLYWRSDLLDGEITTRLVVSEFPLDHRRANETRFGDPRHPSWLGTVALSWPARNFAFHHGEEGTAVWGELFLLGDPALIRRLTRAGGLPPPAPAADPQ